MAKESGKKSFLDFFKMKELDEDEFDDDLFDEDDEDEDDEDDYAPVKSSRNKKSSSRRGSSSYQGGYNQSQAGYRDSQNHYDNYGNRQQRQVSSQQNRVVDFANPRPKSVAGRSEVYVMIPHDTSESQTVADFLKGGKTIVLNMAGLDTTIAQRIIDFVAGSCYALDGSLQAISDNIFIAAPSSIEVSGDLRELINDNAGAPNLYRY